MNLNLKSVREVDPARCDRAISMIRASGFSGPLLIKKRMKGFVNICRVCVTVKRRKVLINMSLMLPYATE